MANYSVHVNTIKCLGGFVKNGHRYLIHEWLFLYVYGRALVICLCGLNCVSCAGHEFRSSHVAACNEKGRGRLLDAGSASWERPVRWLLFGESVWLSRRTTGFQRPTQKEAPKVRTSHSCSRFTWLTSGPHSHSFDPQVGNAAGGDRVRCFSGHDWVVPLPLCQKLTIRGTLTIFFSFFLSSKYGQYKGQLVFLKHHDIHLS